MSPATVASANAFPKQARLLAKPEFDHAFKAGKRLTQGCFAAAVVGSARSEARLGFAIGKRQAPLAVTRNRLKRQFRECFRLSRAALAPVDIVLSLRAAPPEDSRVAVRQFWALIESRCQRSETP